MYEANLQKRWIFRITSRSSRSEVFLEILQNLQENTCAWVSFYYKAAGLWVKAMKTAESK